MNITINSIVYRETNLIQRHVRIHVFSEKSKAIQKQPSIVAEW